MFSDLKYAFRRISSHRWFSAAIIVTIALGIGINTTVFTIVNGVLFKPMPIPGGERLVIVRSTKTTDPGSSFGVSYPDFRELQAANGTFEALEAAAVTAGVIGENGIAPERLRMASVTPGLFGMIRVAPALGRGLSADNAKPGESAVVLISHGVWQKRYGGVSDVLGRAVRIDGEPATIIGVMPKGFRFPNNEEVWMPLVSGEAEENRGHRSLEVYGMLKPGTSLEQAHQDLTVIGSRLATEFPDTNKEITPRVLTFHDAHVGGSFRTTFLMMLGAVAFVLLIACANVANMLLGRAVVRRHEITVRAAMGASRWQIVRQLLVESVILSSLGGLLGLALSTYGVNLFDVTTANLGRPYWITFGMDYVAFGYFAAISILSGIVFGLAPALRASRIDLNTSLKDETRGSARRGGWLTGSLVVLQFALTMVLLAGAGLMVRSFFAVQKLNASVPEDNILLARVQLPEKKGERYAEPTARRQFFEEILPRLAALPGVTQVSAASHPPLGAASMRLVEIEGQPNEQPARAPQALAVIATPGHIPLIGSQILGGRDFEELDGQEGREAAIVTREFANRYWPGELPVGKRFRFVEKNGEKPGPWLSVVGVSTDITQTVRTDRVPPLAYVPYRQEPWGRMALHVRTAPDPSVLAASVRAAVQKVDGELALFDVQTLRVGLERDQWPLKVFGSLFLSFAVIGLLMASVGIYAVVAQSTARRTREIGIRMALGASKGGIMSMVLSRGLVQLALGLGLGVAGALVATQLLAVTGFLVNVSSSDPTVFIGVASLLTAIGLFACWLPARRATRVDPVEVLRTE